MVGATSLSFSPGTVRTIPGASPIGPIAAAAGKEAIIAGKMSAYKNFEMMRQDVGQSSAVLFTERRCKGRTGFSGPKRDPPGSSLKKEETSHTKVNLFCEVSLPPLVFLETNWL
ncbi:MAG: hypothetical protein MPW15_09040 [Candidatus Manganitrophus sp.]|nr:hypothetical protein [Candidatus Manganitrophus sp.]